jgi:hypothetical protein
MFVSTGLVSTTPAVLPPVQDGLTQKHRELVPMSRFGPLTTKPQVVLTHRSRPTLWDSISHQCLLGFLPLRVGRVAMGQAKLGDGVGYVRLE